MGTTTMVDDGVRIKMLIKTIIKVMFYVSHYILDKLRHVTKSGIFKLCP